MYPSFPSRSVAISEFWHGPFAQYTTIRGGLVWQELRRQLVDLVVRDVDRAGQVRVLEVAGPERLDERDSAFLQLPPKLFERDLLVHVPLLSLRVQ